MGVISLIPKTENPIKCEDWRPITLLSYDYKIAASILKTKLNRYLPGIIHQSQAGGVPGRLISDISITINGIWSRALDSSAPLAIVALDLQQAFDRVDWSFLWRVCAKSGIPKPLVEQIAELYSNASSRIKINGTLNPLIEGINDSKEIRGITVHGQNFKTAGFVDDLTCLISTPNSLKPLHEILIQFNKATGSQVNWTKTKGIYIGNGWNQDFLMNLPIDWTQPSLKILGIYYARNMQAARDKQYKLLTEKVYPLLDSWKNSNMNYLQKVSFLKVHVFSRIRYVSSVHVPANTWISTAQTDFARFIWGPKVKRFPLAGAALCAPLQCGGVALPDIASFVECTILWLAVKCYHRKENSFWWNMFNFFYGRIGRRWQNITHRNDLAYAEKPNGMWFCRAGDLLSRLKTEPQNVTFETLYQDCYELSKTRKSDRRQSNPKRWRRMWQRGWSHEIQNAIWRINRQAFFCNNMLSRWNLVANPNCARCGQMETIDHIIWDCIVAKAIWRRLGVTIGTTIKKTDVIFITIPDIEKKKERAWLVLCGIFVFGLWTGRVRHCSTESWMVKRIWEYGWHTLETNLNRSQKSFPKLYKHLFQGLKSFLES